MNLLPSHLSQQDPTDAARDYQERVQLAPPPPSSICVTGVMSVDGTVDVCRTLNDATTVQGTIRYRIFRPRQMKQSPLVAFAPPLIVLHGGPSVPSNYLFSLVNVVVDRSVVFYDQLGCGRSSRPAQPEAYGIQLAVNDLEVLLEHWNLSSFHLYGHSFGGILAFEYLKRTRDGDKKCRSVTMSSVPTSIALLSQESHRLMENIRIEIDDEREVKETFRQRHECRVVPTPLSLVDAYAQAGTVWRGIDAIPDYVASLEGGTTEPLAQPVFVLRGQDDFVTQPCIEGWSDVFETSQSMVLAGCSHHGLLENEQLYGAVLSSFLNDNDPSTATANAE